MVIVDLPVGQVMVRLWIMQLGFFLNTSKAVFMQRKLEMLNIHNYINGDVILCCQD